MTLQKRPDLTTIGGPGAEKLPSITPQTPATSLYSPDTAGHVVTQIRVGSRATATNESLQ